MVFSLVVINGDLMLCNEDLIMIYPLVNKQFASNPVEIVDLPIETGDCSQLC